MSIQITSVGTMTIVNEWDDTYGHQWAFVYDGSNNYTDVLMTFAGYDYGGGIFKTAERVPYSDVYAVLSSDMNSYEMYRAVNELIDSHNT